MSNQREYEKAVENPLFRREFIRGIDLGEARPYVKKILLGTEEKGRLMACRKRTFMMPVVIVYSLAFSFEPHPRWEDFYSSLVHHEGYHAKQRCAGIRFDPLEEFNACINQMRNFSLGNSDKFKERIRGDIEIIMQDFRDFGPHKLIDETNRIFGSLEE